MFYPFYPEKFVKMFVSLFPFWSFLIFLYFVVVPLNGYSGASISNFFTSSVVKVYTREFKKGEEISQILSAELVSPQEINNIANKLKLLQNIIKYDQIFTVKLSLKPLGGYNVVQLMSIELDPSKSVIIKKSGGIFKTAININKNIYKEDIRISHDIEKSVYELNSYEAPNYVIDKLSNLYLPYIDLKNICNPGKLDFLIQIFYEGEKIVKFGDIFYTSFTDKKNKIVLYKHRFKDGSAKFVNVANNSAIGIKMSHLDFTIPVPPDVRISSNFGKRINPITGVLKPHNGVDFATSFGTPVRAANSGKVIYVGTKYGYGKYIRIAHEHGYETAYAHLSKFTNKLKVGSQVRRGDIIAKSGNSGHSTGPHLHYEVIYHGKYIDPMRIHRNMDYAHNFDKEELRLLKNNLDKIERVFAEAPTMKQLS